MRTLLAAFFFCLLTANVCHGFETGKWLSDISNDGFEGELEITRNGNDYTVNRIEFGIRVGDYLDQGCTIQGENTSVAAKGNRLEVYSNGVLGFTIVQHKDYLQVIPHLTVDDLICHKTNVPEWVRSFPGRDAMQAEIASLQWHKVRSFPQVNTAQ